MYDYRSTRRKNLKYRRKNQVLETQETSYAHKISATRILLIKKDESNVPQQRY